MDELFGAGRTAAEMAAWHVAGIAGAPVWRPVSDDDRAWLTGQPLPAAGRPLTELLADVRDRVMPYPMGNGHPRFFGWVNSAPSPAGIAVAPLAAALNPSCAGGEHAGVLLEHSVLRWLAELVGFPHRPGGGLLTSGASMATVIALAAARGRAARRDGWDVREDGLAGQPPMTVYVGAEGHSCVQKAAELLGIGRRGLRTVPCDDRLRMDPEALWRLIEQDVAAGMRPMCVAASAGTVGTGAVDPLAELADIAAAYDTWFHVDGAYGALGVLAVPGPYAGMDRADSLALDPHKWLGVPVDCGCVLVRDPSAVRDTFSLVPAYLRDDGAGDLGWFSEYGPEQTRPLRALRVWATLSHLGRDGVTDLIGQTVARTRELAGLLAAAPDFELTAPVVTSIAAFRHRPPGLPDDELDALNRAIPAAVQRRGLAFLTGTRIADRESLRACLLNPATTTDDLLILLGEIRAAAHHLTRVAGQSGD
ncbi:amino acid decarboxylase [Catellatospora sp. TT07R-123]|uniref:pyridoxal phosphate-dependent decarboxylase family protein n=1 Tax=Catellatospora sp. TT07R-123 TaxID=2733863 RepID=UPI001B1206CE|nr:pyridoxal-dependent decarboxylase [Catellatospora sp. TT07R-123]GHJ48791.1 amino acid decarboxylase [Catellatospora sp. TT07R-123]